MTRFQLLSNNSLTAYYPGNAHVDIVGVDGLDFGGQPLSQMFVPALQSLKAVSLLSPSGFLQADRWKTKASS
jgi:hypothetical protein